MYMFFFHFLVGKLVHSIFLHVFSWMLSKFRRICVAVSVTRIMLTQIQRFCVDRYGIVVLGTMAGMSDLKLYILGLSKSGPLFTIWLQLAAICCLDFLMDFQWKCETSEYFKLRKQALKGI